MTTEYGRDARITGSLQIDGDVDLGSGDDDVSIDRDTLYIDADVNRVGIGVTAPSASLHVVNNVQIDGALSHEDYILAELSIPGVDLQTDTNAFRFNCPYNLDVGGLVLALDQHTTSGNVTVTVTNSTDANQMISLSITDTNQFANTFTVSNAQCDLGDVITVAITATPANAQGLRMGLQVRRRL